jgi:hypothetical protein
MTYIGDVAAPTSATCILFDDPNLVITTLSLSVSVEFNRLSCSPSMEPNAPMIATSPLSL